jgi:hypothetical protein
MRKQYWKQYSCTVKVSGKSGKLAKIIQSKQKQAVECLNHDLDYALFSGSYRKYRRGKGRCSRCGLKTNNPGMGWVV